MRHAFESIPKDYESKVFGSNACVCSLYVTKNNGMAQKILDTCVRLELHRSFSLYQVLHPEEYNSPISFLHYSRNALLRLNPCHRPQFTRLVMLNGFLDRNEWVIHPLRALNNMSWIWRYLRNHTIYLVKSRETKILWSFLGLRSNAISSHED